MRDSNNNANIINPQEKEDDKNCIEQNIDNSSYHALQWNSLKYLQNFPFCNRMINGMNLNEQSFQTLEPKGCLDDNVINSLL